MKKHNGPAKALGIQNQWDVLEKLEWEVERLAESVGGRHQSFCAINACITADYVLDWIWTAVALFDRSAYVTDLLGQKISRLSELKSYARDNSVEMRACMQISNASKHRQLDHHAEDEFAGWRTIVGMIIVDASTAVQREHEILTIQVAQDDVRSAYEVAHQAHAWLSEFVEQTSWPEIHPRNPEGFVSSPS